MTQNGFKWSPGLINLDFLAELVVPSLEAGFLALAEAWKQHIEEKCDNIHQT